MKRTKKAAANRRSVARVRQAKRNAGHVPKERWAHPEDWSEIDALIQRLTAARDEATRRWRDERT